MASVLGGKKRDPKEIIRSQGGASKKGKPGQTMRITGGVSGSGLYNPQQSGVASQNYNVMDNGRLVVNPGVEEYKWNDRLKRYDAVPGMGRGYLLAEQVQAPSAGGGKKGSKAGQAKKKAPGTDGVLVPATRLGGAGSSPGLTTSEITGMSPELINKPQYGVLNWIHQVDPNDQVPPDLGMYVENGMNPGFSPYYAKGVLV